MASSFAPDELPDGRGAPPDVITVQFPLGWILNNASSAIQYRAIIDVAGFTQNREQYRKLALSFPPALRLAMEQGGEGTWGGSMLGIPRNGTSAAGTIPAFRRLLEYGWEKDSPPLIRARRVLFRLLAEDDDVDQLYE